MAMNIQPLGNIGGHINSQNIRNGLQVSQKIIWLAHVRTTIDEIIPTLIKEHAIIDKEIDKVKKAVEEAVAFGEIQVNSDSFSDEVIVLIEGLRQNNKL